MVLAQMSDLKSGRISRQLVWLMTTQTTLISHNIIRYTYRVWFSTRSCNMGLFTGISKALQTMVRSSLHDGLSSCRDIPIPSSTMNHPWHRLMPGKPWRRWLIYKWELSAMNGILIVGLSVIWFTFVKAEDMTPYRRAMLQSSLTALYYCGVGLCSQVRNFQVKRTAHMLASF